MNNLTLAKFKNNKGFTLVELIIVIAIIAILAAVLSPQFIQYVERSRQSNDLQVAQTIVDSSIYSVIDPSNGVSGNSQIYVQWTTGGGFKVSDLNSNSGETSEAVKAVYTDILTTLGCYNEIAEEKLSNGGAKNPKTPIVPSPKSSAANGQNLNFTIDMSSGVIVYGKGNNNTIGNVSEVWGEGGIGLNLSTNKLNKNP